VPSARPTILLLQPFMKQIESGLDDGYQVKRIYEAGNRDELLAEIGPHVRDVVTGGAFGLPRVMMDSLPKLEIICDRRTEEQPSLHGGLPLRLCALCRVTRCSLTFAECLTGCCHVVWPFCPASHKLRQKTPNQAL
jgi:hypothetical protein